MIPQTSLFDAPAVPTHKTNPAPSELAAARRAAGRVGSETRLAFGVIVAAGRTGATNRDIQLALWRPELTAWNKVATRTRGLEAAGVVESRVDPATGDRITRPAADGVETLVYWVTPHGADVWRLISERSTP